MKVQDFYVENNGLLNIKSFFMVEGSSLLHGEIAAFQRLNEKEQIIFSSAIYSLPGKFNMLKSVIVNSINICF